MPLGKIVFVGAFVLCAPLVLRADSVTYYPNFSSTTGLTHAGNATTVTTADGTVLRLVGAAVGQSGAEFSTTPVTLGAGNSFSTQFQFRITDPGGIDPADGITFVLAASPTGLGGGGGGIGYGGVGHSVAVEFDTYENDEYGDFNDNHVGLDTNGSLVSVIKATPYGVGSCDTRSGSIAGCMSNGDLWTALITYDGAYLNLSLTDGSDVTENLISNYAIDVGANLGTNTAYVGFTGGTGAGYENEDILNWEFSNTSTLPPPPASTPEPASLLLLGSGLTGIAAMKRRLLRRA